MTYSIKILSILVFQTLLATLGKVSRWCWQ